MGCGLYKIQVCEPTRLVEEHIAPVIFKLHIKSSRKNEAVKTNCFTNIVATSPVALR